jgi:hypothetical protein
VELTEKQALLEELSSARRLEMELDLLRREAENLRPRMALELKKRFSRQ